MLHRYRDYLRTGTSALAIGVVVATGVALAATAILPTPVFAAEGAGGNHGGGNPSVKGGGHGGGHGGAGGDHASVGEEGDDGDGPDGRGPNYGKPASGTTGGLPAWASEGIPDIELGRLNVARSPDRVLTQAFSEALKNFDDETAVFYTMNIDDTVAYIGTNWETLVMVDSPLENLALLRDALDGTSILNSRDDIDNDVWTLAAIFLGVASDKNMSVTEDTVTAISTILGYPDLSDALITQIAEDAEAIRVAVAAAHG